MVLEMCAMNQHGEWYGATRNKANLWMTLCNIFKQMIEEGKVTKVNLHVSMTVNIESNVYH